MKKEIEVYYLEMTAPEQLQAKATAEPELEVKEAQISLPELNRFLYTAVGAEWNWWVRRDWNYKQWQQWLETPGVRTWVAYQKGTPAGYFELSQATTDNNEVELAYFGILSQFIGRGLGGQLLTTAVQQAWQSQPQPPRVWLHTCTLDHPHALANYQARGFRLYKRETVVEDLPEEPLEPWPGAYAE